MASSRSSGPASATTPRTSSVAGLTVSKVRPDRAALSSPPIRSRSSPTTRCAGRGHQAPPTPKIWSQRSSVIWARGSSTSSDPASSSAAARSLWARREAARMAPDQSLVVGVGERCHGRPEHQPRRTPDLGVAGLDHLGQVGEVDSGRLGQHLALVGGQPRSVGHQVAGQLGGQAASEGSHGHRQRADGVEDRPEPGDDIGVAADHADQFAGGGRGRPSGDATVEHRHAEGRGLGADGPDARDRDGAHDDDGGVGAGGGQAPVRTGQDGVDLGIVDHGHHHHVRLPDQVGGRSGHRRRVAVPVGGLGPKVADHQGQSGAGHAGGHPVADGPEADDPDDGLGPVAGSVG